MEIVDEFIEKFIENTPSNIEQRRKVLEELEEKYYNRFKDVYQNIIKMDILKTIDVQKLQNFLWNLKARLYKIYEST